MMMKQNFCCPLDFDIEECNIRKNLTAKLNQLLPRVRKVQLDTCTSY